MIKPTIIIKVCTDQEKVVSEVLAGIEEEGVLYEVLIEPIFKSAHLLAKEAAQLSQVEVGIGITEKKTVLTLHKLGERSLLSTDQEYRILGQNAARYVKGNSFTQMIGGEL